MRHYAVMLALAMLCAAGCGGTGVGAPGDGTEADANTTGDRTGVPPAGSHAPRQAPESLGVIHDLAGVRGSGEITLDWTYFNTGDYNQDREVNISDLTPLGSAFGTHTGDPGFNFILDGDFNGEIGLSDITPMGANYHRRVTHYRVYMPSGPIPFPEGDPLVEEVPFSASSVPVLMRYFRVTLTDPADVAGEYYYIVPYDATDGTEGFPSNIVQVPPPDTTPPAWDASIGVTGLIPGDGTVTPTWGPATDADSPPVHYVVYYSEGASVDFGTAQTVEVSGQLGAQISGLTNGTQYSFAVRARDSASPPNFELNTVQLSITPTQLLFDLPPGPAALAPLAIEPSLALLPASAGVADGAPVVAYAALDEGGRLYLARYRAGAWEKLALQPQLAFSRAEVVAEGDRRAIVAYDTANKRLLLLEFNTNWEQTSSANIASSPADRDLTWLAVDYAAAADTVGVAYVFGKHVKGFPDQDFATVGFAQAGPAGGSVTVDPSLFDATELCQGLTFRFDPAGGDPWLLFSHGTLDRSEGYVLDTQLTQARRGAGGWTLAAVDHPAAAPLRVDLGFDAGVPQLALTAARTRFFPLVGNPFRSSLQYDAEVGSWDGAAWTFTRIFNSSQDAEVEGGFPPDFYRITVNSALDVRWARPSELALNIVSGYTIVDAYTLVPSDQYDDNLQIAAQYRTAADSYAADTGYFTGLPGLSFGWDSRGGMHGDAYISYATLQGEELMDRYFTPAAELEYWQP